MSLIARDISLSLQGKTILGGIDFTARSGEVTAIVGPNGSGKTTLLRALTGEEATDGQVELNGVTVHRKMAPKLATMRGVLSQSTQVAFPFKAAEVVRIGHQSGRYADQLQVPEQALAKVGLAGFGPRFYQELSGGEQQRVQLARVLAQIWEPVCDGNPCWLFLDEPVASLDIGHQLTIMQLAREFARGGGGVVVVMHDLNLTAMFADTIALMQSGRVICSGPPEAVLTSDVLSDAYDCQIAANTLPAEKTAFILPQAARF